MPFHQRVQQLLLAGARLALPNPPPRCPAPDALVPLIDAVAPNHAAYNHRAIEYGNRYRSAFWLIYLLVPLAVLFAGLPGALGWDADAHPMHRYAGSWGIAEVAVIVLVAAIYAIGHRQDWQGQWLEARTRAELAWYLPMVAPFVDFASPDERGNWYACLEQGNTHVPPGDEFRSVCEAQHRLAGGLMYEARNVPGFADRYVDWVASLLAGQQYYHRRMAMRQRTLRHRIHRITTWLFGLTALAAIAHLAWHSAALSLATIFFPALGASLHGALAQSEAYRLQATSERLVLELGEAAERIRQAASQSPILERGAPLGEAVLAALHTILDEHQDWHMLVRPHHLPLG